MTLKTKDQIVLHYPKESQNPYISRMTDIFSNLGFGKLEGLTLKSLMAPEKNRSIYFLNWIENLAVKFSVPGLLALALIIITIKLKKGKIIWVKHNRTPHTNDPFSGVIASIGQKLIEKNTDLILCHGAKYAAEFNHYYIPHPLPKSHTTTVNAAHGDYFICFGRMLRYKRLEELIKDWPPHLKLMIVGSFEKRYLREISKLSRSQENIIIIDKYLPESGLNSLVVKSLGSIIPNDGSTSIISGGIFLSLSLGVPVFTTSERIASEVGGDIPGLYKINHWSDINYIRAPETRNIRKAAELRFGDDIVSETLENALLHLTD